MFDPPIADLEPTLPFVAAERKVVLLRNDTDRPIEVYSLDFDDQYLAEEEIVRSMDLWEQQEAAAAEAESAAAALSRGSTPAMGRNERSAEVLLRFPPREAGSGLPDAILAAEQRRLDIVAAAEAKATARERCKALQVDVARTTPGDQGRIAGAYGAIATAAWLCRQMMHA